jgi:glycosyltransferase involved in cell wall biosynthesis
MIGAFKAEYWGLAFAARRAGVPLALFSHLDQRIRPVMLNSALAFVRGVIVPSAYLQRRTIERGLPASRVAVLRNPIDVDRFRPAPTLRSRVRESMRLDEDAVLLGYAGRLESAKGVLTLAQALNHAMAKDARVHALWVGHGDQEDEVRAVAAGGGFAERHHWLPWQDDMLAAYAAMDIVALPSEGSETFGRVLVEAQACGIPVLGARNGGIPETLCDGHTGRLLTPGDVAQWAGAITDLVENQEARLRLAGAARGFALAFDSRRVAADLLPVLDSFEASAPPSRESWIQQTRPELIVRLAREGLVD